MIIIANSTLCSSNYFQQYRNNPLRKGNGRMNLKKIVRKLLKTNLLVLVVFIFFVDLFFRWASSFFCNSLQSEPLANILVVTLFLSLSYLLETKLVLSIYWHWFVYTLLMFPLGVITSVFIYKNSINLNSFIMYFILSIIGAILWAYIIKLIIVKK